MPLITRCQATSPHQELASVSGSHIVPRLQYLQWPKTVWKTATQSWQLVVQRQWEGTQVEVNHGAHQRPHATTGTFHLWASPSSHAACLHAHFVQKRKSRPLWKILNHATKSEGNYFPTFSKCDVSVSCQLNLKWGKSPSTSSFSSLACLTARANNKQHSSGRKYLLLGKTIHLSFFFFFINQFLIQAAAEQLN